MGCQRGWGLQGIHLNGTNDSREYSEIIAQLVPLTFLCCNFRVKNYRINSHTNFCCNFYLVSSRIDLCKKAPPCAQIAELILVRILCGNLAVIKFSDEAFFAYSWKLPAYNGALLLTVDNFSFFTYSWSFFAYSFSFFTYSWSFLAYSGKVRLIRAYNLATISQ